MPHQTRRNKWRPHHDYVASGRAGFLCCQIQIHTCSCVIRVWESIARPIILLASSAFSSRRLVSHDDTRRRGTFIRARGGKSIRSSTWPRALRLLLLCPRTLLRSLLLVLLVHIATLLSLLLVEVMVLVLLVEVLLVVVLLVLVLLLLEVLLLVVVLLLVLLSLPGYVLLSPHRHLQDVKEPELHMAPDVMLGHGATLALPIQKDEEA